MTIHVFRVLTAVIVGMMVGMFYFGGLWLTVQRISHMKRQALLIFISFIGRMAVTLFIFYLFMSSHWEQLIFCLLGFLLMRKVLIHRLGHARMAY